jgi:catalase
MLQGRLFGYGDTHRYRLGVNHFQIPVNSPHVATAANHQRDGAVTVTANHAGQKNYEPNSFGGPIQTNQALYTALDVDGSAASYPAVHRTDGDDFTQPGDLYRLIDETAKERLVTAIGGNLGKVSGQDIIDRAIGHFAAADPDYGARVAAAVKAFQAQTQVPPRDDPAQVILPVG